jgi:hypothetical protein
VGSFDLIRLAPSRAPDQEGEPDIFLVGCRKSISRELPADPALKYGEWDNINYLIGPLLRT